MAEELSSVTSSDYLASRALDAERLASLGLPRNRPSRDEALRLHAALGRST
ncbi:hypothetical protein [Ensifer canadensis]